MSAVSILDVLATLPTGERGPALTLEELGRYIGRHYANEDEKQRNDRHCFRDELYRDGGTERMNAFVTNIFTDPLVRDLRLKWVKYARFNNVTKRIVNELSTVYSEPAHRVVGVAKAPEIDTDDDGKPEPLEIEPPDPNNDKYQRVLDAVRMDERMVEVNRLLNLHRALLVGFRVRENADGTREPVIDIATPANVRAVMHPNDATVVAGWLIRVEYRSARTLIDQPAWVLWTDYESVFLRDDFSIIGDSYKEHTFGVCPWVPVTLGPPGPGFWPGNEGEDLVAAHVTIWFNNILLLKESKSATKQTIISGDGTSMARGQAADTETPIELADGQNATTVDMSMDLALFRDTNQHVLYNTAHNYGMSPAIVDHQGVQSAEARELQRLPLREIRRQQQVPLRRFEQSFAIVMSKVLAVDLPELSFIPDNWRIEFAESETPLDPVTEHTLFLQRRQAGLTSTVEFVQQKRPGLTDEDALALIQQNVTYETERVRMMKEFMAMSGALGANAQGDGAPVDNKVPRNVSGPRGDGTGGDTGGGDSGAPAAAA